MRTIALYSYKGGTGRTFTAINLALALARFGKSVFLLDFDFEAPGIVDKLMTAGFSVSHRQGFVDYVAEYFRNGILGSLRKKVQVINSPTGEAKIHVFGCGDVQDDDYFKILSSEEWLRFFNGEPVGAAGENILSFLNAFKTRIASELRPAPSYLIVDSRAGVNEFSGLSTRFIARHDDDHIHQDAVVLFTLDTDESFRGTRRILQGFGLAQALNEPHPSPDMVRFVLSRIPHNYTVFEKNQEELVDVGKEKLRTRLREARSKCTENLDLARMPPIYAIRNDSRIQFKEELIFDVEGPPMRSPVADDFQRFFAELVEPDFPELRGHLTKIVEEYPEHRAFLLRVAYGQMVNPQDDSLNVAFRVDTLNRTFRTLYKSLGGKAGKAFWDAGYGAAESFSEDLQQEWAKRKYEMNVVEKLHEWCTFDSQVGFGKFESRFFGSGLEGEIILVYNFLRQPAVDSESEEGGEPGEVDLSPYFEGYITRILQAAFERESKKGITVACREGEYTVRGEELPASIFSFEVSEVADAEGVEP